MTPKEKAKELFESMYNEGLSDRQAKECALIAVENEYNSLREYLFNLRSSRVIESEEVYLKRLQNLINEEKEVKQEINNFI